MTPRSIRRAAERKANKLARKASPVSETPTALTDESERAALPPSPSSISPAQFFANLANSQKSTGPKSVEGKAASAQNGIKHGLTATFFVQSWEDEQAFDRLVADMRAEFPPESATEDELVTALARHCWLARRAVLLQEYCFDLNSPRLLDDKQLALYMRYQTTHERAFHKAHSTLLSIRAGKEKRRNDIARAEAARQNGFASQKRNAAAQTRKEEMHQLQKSLKQVQISRYAAPVEAEKSGVELPGLVQNPLPDQAAAAAQAQRAA